MEFKPAFKMLKIVNCVSYSCYSNPIKLQIYNAENQLKWDKCAKDAKFIPIVEGKKSFGINYSSNKK